jgi:hypothetical protein
MILRAACVMKVCRPESELAPVKPMDGRINWRLIKHMGACQKWIMPPATFLLYARERMPEQSSFAIEHAQRDEEGHVFQERDSAA